MFLLIEAKFAPKPLVPLGVFKLRSLTAANGIAITIGAGLFGLYFFLSLYLQQVNHYSPLKAGLAFLPAGLSTMIGAIIGTHLVQRLGARRQLLLGTLLAAAGLIWIAQLDAGSGYLAHIGVPLVLFGVGLGLSFVPMTVSGTATSRCIWPGSRPG